MASLKVVSDRLDDNSLKVAVVIPPRRNGEPNFGALERAIYGLHVLNPDAFDPKDPPAVSIAARDGHTADGGGLVLAEMRHDAAEAANPLNTADTVGPGEA